ncbi:hypothetical protein [Cellulomonas sp. ICMP 17802]|uniref:hypothetical protein n=1 Tax=Cellulomonas sp. ICMP 17802 TaxID=3239199 RepID=UPI00351B298F
MAAAWFLAISPTLSAAADLRSQAEQTRQQNDLLAMKVTKLKADFAKLPEYQASLAAIRTQIPVDGDLANYLRQLDQIAVAHSVTLTAVTPSAGQSMELATPVEQPAPAPASAEGTEAAASAAESGDGSTAAEAPASGVPAGMTDIPFSITVLGSYDNTLAFLYDLQHTTPRLFLVSGFASTAQQQADATAGKPSTAVGDQEMVIGGFVYAIPDAAAVPAPVDPAAAPPAVPGPVPGKNPLVPITGR